MKNNLNFPVKDEYPMERKKIIHNAIFLTSLLFIVLLILGYFINIQYEAKLLEDTQQTFSKEIALHSVNLTHQINNKLSVMQGLYSFINAKLQNQVMDELDEDELNDMMENLYENSTGILNIAVAPGGIFEYVYPYEENKSVIGYEPLKDARKTVRDDVLRAMEKKSVVLSLPIELIQGGTGVIARQAIFVDDEFWGIISIVLTLDSIVADSNIDNPSEEITFALLNQNGQIFLGPEYIFENNPVGYDVNLQEGKWLLVGYPTAGWSSYYDFDLLSFRLLGLSIIILITILVFLVYFRQIQLARLVKLRTADAFETNILLQEDIKKRVFIEEELKINQNHLEKVISQTPIALLISEANGNIQSFNNKFIDQFGYTLQDISNMEEWWNLAYPDEDYRLKAQKSWEKATEVARVTGLQIETQEWDITIKDGSKRKVEFDMMPLGDISVIALNDVTERNLAETKLQYMATHDALTNLPNRDYLNENLTHSCALAKLAGKKLYVLFLDLDGFKAINDAFGHKQGDWLLNLISERLENSVRRSDTVARLGGDEFAAILDGFGDMSDVIPILEKIVKNVSKPFKINNSENFVTCSLGISAYPKDGTLPEILLQKADTAMYHAKKHGKNKFQFYTEEMETQMLEKLELRNKLRLAVEKNELELNYQPQVDSSTGRIIGVEALVRWQHPELGLLLPGKFIAEAEETGLIIPIGKWILDHSCKQLREWLDLGFTNLRLSVNISELELRNENFINLVQSTINKYSIPPSLLELELTENIIFKDIEDAQILLQNLKKIGIRLAIDDFGTGYSALSQLAHFPFDTIKIDQHFSSHVLVSNNDAAVVTSLINIAKNLELDVVAEGVENPKELAFYERLGCHLIQGNYYCKAVTPDEILQKLEVGFE